MGSRGKNGVIVDKLLKDGVDRHLLMAAIQDCSPQNDPGAARLLKALENRVAFHRHVLLKSKRIHFWIGITLAILIPVGSATLTYFATAKPHGVDIGMIGLLLTICTMVNSVFRPTERYISASHKLVDLHDWEMQFVLGLRKQHSEDYINLNDFLEGHDKKLSMLGAEIADQLFPEEIVRTEPTS